MFWKEVSEVKKLISTLLFMVMLIFMPGLVSAQNRNNQVQNQNQIQIQNQGEDQQLQVTTQEQENLQEGQATGQPKSISPRSEAARERMSMVAQTVEELLIVQGAKDGIGQQISAVARKQQQVQQEIEGELGKVEARQGWLKKLFGPNYRALKNLKKQIEQNRLRIQQLTQLQNQVTNQADEAQLQEVIQALIEQDTALEEQIQAEEQIGSLFGWLAKLFDS